MREYENNINRYLTITPEIKIKSATSSEYNFTGL